jgi:hypothetical protein
MFFKKKRKKKKAATDPLFYIFCHVLGLMKYPTHVYRVQSEKSRA